MNLENEFRIEVTKGTARNIHDVADGISSYLGNSGAFARNIVQQYDNRGGLAILVELAEDVPKETGYQKVMEAARIGRQAGARVELEKRKNPFE